MICTELKTQMTYYTIMLTHRFDKVLPCDPIKYNRSSNLVPCSEVKFTYFFLHSIFLCTPRCTIYTQHTAQNNYYHHHMSYFQFHKINSHSHSLPLCLVLIPGHFYLPDEQNMNRSLSLSLFLSLVSLRSTPLLV